MNSLQQAFAYLDAHPALKARVWPEFKREFDAVTAETVAHPNSAQYSEQAAAFGVVEARFIAAVAALAQEGVRE